MREFNQSVRLTRSFPPLVVGGHQAPFNVKNALSRTGKKYQGKTKKTQRKQKRKRNLW